MLENTEKCPVCGSMNASRVHHQSSQWGELRPEIHFAWDLMAHSKKILAGLELYKAMAKRKPHGLYGKVYVLTNYNTTMEENLHRIYTVQEMGYAPYVMVYDKPNAPKEIRHLQRWCNSAQIRNSEPDFYKYDPKKRRKAVMTDAV